MTDKPMIDSEATTAGAVRQSMGLLNKCPDCGGDIRLVPVSGGLVAVVSASDYSDVSRFRWFKLKGPKTFYATSGREEVVHKCGSKLLHRYLMSPPRRLLVDHVDGNGLNNCRCNLRLCTKADNNRNRVHTTSTQPYRGVRAPRGRRKRWEAQISVDNKNRSLGFFETAREAALAYDQAAKQHFGEFAVLNFPERSERIG